MFKLNIIITIYTLKYNKNKEQLNKSNNSVDTFRVSVSKSFDTFHILSGFLKKIEMIWTSKHGSYSRIE